jgi:hypothetical protein
VNELNEKKKIVDCGKEFRDREKRLQDKQDYWKNLHLKEIGEEYNCCVLGATWMHLNDKYEVKKCIECGKLLELRCR